MERLIRHSAKRDEAFGRYFAKRGASRVLTEAELAPPNRERVARWRIHYANIPIEQTIATPRKKT